MRGVVPWTLALVLAAAWPAAAEPGVRVIVNGVPASLAAPAVTQAGQLMVPAVRVFEHFGAAAVWRPADRTILITNRTGLAIRLRVGEATADVNGRARPLPVAPVVIGAVPYVPAHAVFMLLGAWVRHDDDARVLHVASQITALQVRRADGAVRVVLEATGPLRAETRRLPDPERLVVDLHGGAFRLPDQDHPVGDAGVVRVRAGQFQTKPYVTRVVFDLDRAVDARVLAAPDSFALLLEVRPLGAPAAQTRPPAPPVAAPQPPPPAPDVAPSPPVAAGPPAITPAQEPPSTHEAPVAPAEPAPDDGLPRIRQVRVEQLSARFRVIVEGTTPLTYTVRELPEPDRIVVDVADAIFVPVKQEIPVAGAVVEEVRAAQFQTEPNVTRVVVVLRRKTAYTVFAGGDAGQFLVVEIPEPSLRAHVVAIDAGHGGRDPGAIGPTGLQEKDVVLDIAQRVRELLVRAGVRVVMTRETDTFVDLPDRPRAAKQQGASVFVSIHANASTRPAVAGSETYYLSPQSLVLAQLIQEELGRVQGLANRGVRTANFLVLREADMPAVLVEVAYLSNADEEARLRQAAFRQRLAEAVSRAVQRFLAVYPVPAH
ncbi:MAG: N-acetylmuramoyl-L-alanine amidase family protein [Armatimonadota bacterium]|nr:N-acetylmuramoyl-L-alanine amidase family protein [Armatimonadota bacterium]MDR7452955.1 N-acetylmuramoyl-L-alanine amidase family protein [Armatimonadota bacterium]MDR7456354.1 N-acetylmuramoyl-L-alanine amidase family protein [Armatimonadota bacterium]MDR7496704.1 N-acetylmuramoyl-L-alanine amidase family protein [Armatimonadota bacterium]